MKRIICTTFMSLLSVIIVAQPLDTGLFQGVIPTQEKVYLHFDNNTYFQGDTIWYKAYVVMADNNVPKPYSRVLYVELLDEQGYLKERQQLVVDEEGQANGRFALNDTAFAGFYEVRAYTKWMLNFGYGRMLKKDDRWYVKDMHGIHPFIYAGKETNFPNAISPGERVVDSFREPSSFDPKNYLNLITHYNIEMDEVQWAYMLDDTVFNNEQHPASGDFYDLGLTFDPDLMRKDYRTYNNLFSRVLPVYSRPDSMENYKRRIMPAKITMGDYNVWWKSDNFGMRFYPEGGEIIEGVKCRVGWEAYNQELSRLNIRGALYEDDVVIDSLIPIHAGRGLFSFIPRQGKNYKVKYESRDNKFSFNLPEIKKEGVSISVTQDEVGVYVDLYTRFTQARQLYMSITGRGKLIKNYKLNRDSTFSVAIDITDLPEGVNQATVYDKNGTIYADRLFFVNDFEILKGNIAVDGIVNRAYRPLEKINLSLLATNGRGLPLKDQTFSVSVRDADQLDNSFATGNIMTNLLLESEIKGFVETPDYYFESNDEHHRKALDLLLMIQGWRRYDWQEMARPQTFIADYLPETHMIINGDVIGLRKNIFGQEKGPIDVFCSLRNLDMNIPKGKEYLFQGHVTADTLKHFHIAYEPFYGKAKLVLRAKYENKLDKSEYAKLQHDPKIFIRKEYFYPRNRKQYSWYETNAPDDVPNKQLTWEDLQDNIYASEWIPQVTIKSKKRPYSKHQTDKPVFSMKYIDYLNEVWDRGYYNPFNLLDYQMKVDDYAISHNIHLHYVTSVHNDERWMISYGWNITENAKVLNAFIPVLDSLYVVSDDPIRPTAYELHHLDRMGVDNGESYAYSGYVNITTVSNDSTLHLVGREYTLPGFTRPTEYYNPDYSKTKLPQVKDYRRTLYWNPSIKTDKFGRANISFYNNSVCTELNVSAEGITKKGEFLIVR